MTDEIRRIDNPPEIMWVGSRSPLLTLRHGRRVLRTDSVSADDLLALAHADARRVVYDADPVVKAARGNSPGLREPVDALVESIEGELDADEDADEQGAVEDAE